MTDLLDPGRPRRAHDVLGLLLDAGSFTSWDSAPDLSGHDAAYRAELRAAAIRAGNDEAVVTGSGTVSGRRVALIVSEYAFLGGSIGRAATHRIRAAVKQATSAGLPLIASTASGGTRMQEGTPAFLGMVEIVRAIAAHRAAGLPYVAHLRHPTTGGVYASWASLAHLTLAEPGALVGFLGPKVYETLKGAPFPRDVQTAENLAAHGVIDAAVPTTGLRDVINRALGVLYDPVRPPRLPPRGGATRTGDAWQAIERTRSPSRVSLHDLLKHGTNEVVPLSGTGEGGRDDTVLVALARVDGHPCVLVGQDRVAQAERPLGPDALRQARRGMRLAEGLQLPLVTIVDTPGADLSPAAEQNGLAREIANCLDQLTKLRVPSLSVLLGQGCGGAALALLPADRVIATESAWLTPLPPEGASTILHGTAAHAAKVAQTQHVRASDLMHVGVVHHVLAEHQDDTPEELAIAVAAEIGLQLRKISPTPPRGAHRHCELGSSGSGCR